MTNTIQIDYEEVDQICNRFANQADGFRSMNREIISMVDNLRAGAWQGVGADRFYAEIDEQIMPTLDRLVQAMELARENLNAINNKFQAKEEEARDCIREV